MSFVRVCGFSRNACSTGLVEARNRTIGEAHCPQNIGVAGIQIRNGIAGNACLMRCTGKAPRHQFRGNGQQDEDKRAAKCQRLSSG